jgi:hypothetical protein
MDEINKTCILSGKLVNTCKPKIRFPSIGFTGLQDLQVYIINTTYNIIVGYSVIKFVLYKKNGVNLVNV